MGGNTGGRRVLAVVQIKGGTGKSTIAAHAVGWLAKQGRDVAVVDADPQQATTRWLGEALPDVESITALSADDVLSAVEELEAQHELVVCDGPAGESDPTRALMLVADLVVLPCGPSVLDLRALRDTAYLLRQVRKIRRGEPDAVVVLNRQQPRTLVSRDVIDAAPELGLRVATSIIRQRVAIADAAGQAAFVWDLGAGAREAAAEMEKLLMEVLADGSTEAAERGGSGPGGGIHRKERGAAEGAASQGP